MSERIASLIVERRQLSELIPHPRNPRKHPKPGSQPWQVLERSLERDYFDPLVVNGRNGYLVSGHLRHKVMMAMGFTEADVVVVDYDEATHFARMIAANTLLGEFEATILASLARELDAAGIDSALAGLDEKGLMALLEGPEIADDTQDATELVSKADELQVKWQVRLGDLYQIGDHRLLCGACEAPDNWAMLLAGVPADMLWTDPPYNIDYEGLQKFRNEVNIQRGKHPGLIPQAIINDDLSDKEYAALLITWFSAAAQFLKPGAACYIAHAEAYGTETRIAARVAGFKIAQCLIWAKNAFTLGRQDHQWQHEPILYGWRHGGGHYWQGGYKQTTVIDEETNLKKLSKPELVALVNHMRNERDTTIIREPRNQCNALHPTVKPLPLVARQIWNSSRKGETVMELFGGSGTTLAAAQQTGRRCAATELDPKYCSVILERMQAYGLVISKLHGPS